jgi:SAM-dependent methyltransferase
MRVTYRSAGVKEYWEKRWANIPADKPMENLNAYPLKYAELTVKNDGGAILEAGCGAGRILRYYKDRGYPILGMDFIDCAVVKLKAIDADLNVEVGDITNMIYADERFRYVLAFGLYHNLEGALLERSFTETFRVLSHGGKVCASFRADNLQTRLTDWLANYRARKAGVQGGPKSFHKMNLTRAEYENMFRKAGFKVLNTFPVENMPILYKFALFRAASHKLFDENKARKEGYRLSMLGNLLQRFLMRFFPDQFCNIFVVIAQKP